MSKKNMSMAAKMKPTMYTPKQRAAYVPCPCDELGRPKMSMAIILALADKQADEKISGRFDTSDDNICKTCFQAKSVNGACHCTE